MPDYEVTIMRGACEVYLVSADTEEHALEILDRGDAGAPIASNNDATSVSVVEGAKIVFEERRSA